MPYIITTHTVAVASLTPSRNRSGGTASRAVTTLDEARATAIEVVDRLPGDGYNEWHAEADNLPDAGGTIGPLPDGTVIEVARVEWEPFATDIGYDYAYVADGMLTEADIIDAFNGAHVS